MKLIEALLELKVKGIFNGENDNGFNKSYKKEIEKMLKEKLSGHNLGKKFTYWISMQVAEESILCYFWCMNNDGGSDLGWNDEKKCATIIVNVWDDSSLDGIIILILLFKLHFKFI